MKKDKDLNHNSVLLNSDDTLNKPIRVSCQAADTIELDELTPFQGKLKTLSEEAYQRLRKSILELGVSFPICAWKHRNKTYIFDAHQRVLTIKRMRDEEGFRIPRLPVVWVEAANKVEAAKKVLAATSQYGEITPQGLYDFMQEFELNLDSILGTFQFPEIDLGSFRLSYFPETKEVTFNARQEWSGMPEFNQEDKTSFRHVIVHFIDQAGVDDFFNKISQKDTGNTRSIWYPPQPWMETESKRYE